MSKWSWSADYGTRKDPLFGVLVACTSLVLVVLCVSASKIAREVGGDTHVYWMVSYTIGLSTVTACYQALYISYYPTWSSIPFPGARNPFALSLATNFVLSSAWVVATAVQAFDPNDLMNMKRSDTSLVWESEANYHTRFILSAAIAAGMFAITALLVLRLVCVAPPRRQRQRHRSGTVMSSSGGERRARDLVQMERVAEVEEVEEGGRASEDGSRAMICSAGGKGRVKFVLGRFGIGRREL